MTEPGDMRQEADELVARFAELTAAEFVAECRDFWRNWGTLPTALAEHRRAALCAVRVEAANNGQKISFVARLHGLSPNRFSKLTAPGAAA